MDKQFGDVHVSDAGDFVAIAEIQRGPNNFFDQALIASLADAFSELDEDPSCRVIVLCSEGKHFCAGANFGSRERDEEQRERTAESGNPLYREAVRLFGNKKQVIAAVQGAAVGGGLGLAVSADFRIACPESRFSANFSRLGFHQGNPRPECRPAPDRRGLAVQCKSAKSPTASRPPAHAQTERGPAGW